jgi:hypothetical protein
MWLYRASAQNIASDPYLLANLESDYQARHVSGSAAGPGDVRAWRRSVTHLAQELRHCGLGQVFMFIEYDLKLDPAQTGESSAPIDVVLAGAKPGTDEPSYVAVELKQWSDVGRVDGQPEKVFVPRYNKPKPHPAAQVDRNRRQLVQHLDAFADRYVELHALAYLHNLNSESTQWITDYSASTSTTVITGQTPQLLREYLLAHLSTTDDGSAAAKAAQRLSQSRVIPSSPLQQVFGEVLKGRAGYNLVDEQRKAFDEITTALKKPSGAPQDVFLIKGRPWHGEERHRGQSAELGDREGSLLPLRLGRHRFPDDLPEELARLRQALRLAEEARGRVRAEIRGHRRRGRGASPAAISPPEQRGRDAPRGGDHRHRAQSGPDPGVLHRRGPARAPERDHLGRSDRGARTRDSGGRLLQAPLVQAVARGG